MAFYGSYTDNTVTTKYQTEFSLDAFQTKNIPFSIIFPWLYGKAKTWDQQSLGIKDYLIFMKRTF